jgi:hypothetical protein
VVELVALEAATAVVGAEAVEGVMAGQGVRATALTSPSAVAVAFTGRDGQIVWQLTLSFLSRSCWSR